MRILIILLFFATPAQAQLGGPGWSPGLAIATNLVGEFETIAVIDEGGIVRIIEEKKQQVLPILEGHVSFPVKEFLAIGPFAAISPGDQIINQIGFGGLAEFRTVDRVFTIGFGLYLNPSAEILRSDFIPGEPAPNGVTEVKYVRKGIWRSMILFGLQFP